VNGINIFPTSEVNKMVNLAIMRVRN